MGWNAMRVESFFVEPNFSSIVNAVNELRAKNGQDPVAIVTPQEAAEKERADFKPVISEKLKSAYH